MTFCYGNFLKVTHRNCFMPELKFSVSGTAKSLMIASCKFATKRYIRRYWWLKIPVQTNFYTPLWFSFFNLKTISRPRVGSAR